MDIYLYIYTSVELLMDTEHLMIIIIVCDDGIYWFHMMIIPLY